MHSAVCCAHLTSFSLTLSGASLPRDLHTEPSSMGWHASKLQPMPLRLRLLLRLLLRLRLRLPRPLPLPLPRQHRAS